MSPAAVWCPTSMTRPVVHFEIIGSDPTRLQAYYRELFGWDPQPGDATTETVSAPGQYGFVDSATSGSGINGGVGGGEGHRPHVIFYIQVPDVAAALQQAEDLGGQRVMGPEGKPGTLIVAHFTDPEGNLVGLAGPK